MSQMRTKITDQPFYEVIVAGVRQFALLNRLFQLVNTCLTVRFYCENSKLYANYHI